MVVVGAHFLLRCLDLERFVLYVVKVIQLHLPQFDICWDLHTFNIFGWKLIASLFGCLFP